MKIKDLNGETIVVTDLEEAIEQADTYRNYEDLENKTFSENRRLYWQDLYEKLKGLEENSNYRKGKGRKLG